MCRLLFQPRTYAAYTEKMSQLKLTVFEVVVKGYHECSFSVSVEEKYIVRRKRRDRGPALKVLDDNDRGQQEQIQRELVSVLWPLTDKVEVSV